MAADVNAPLYTPDILRLAASIEAPRELERVDGRADLPRRRAVDNSTAVTCDGEGRVIALSQTVSACAFGQASASLLESGARGKSPAEVRSAVVQLSDWLSGQRDDPGDWPGLSALAPARAKTGRHGAILLPFRALLAAIEQTR